MIDIFNLLIFIIPAYVANSSPVILGGGTPIDLGKKMNGKRILGDGKTIRGFAGGVLAGTLVGFVISQLYRIPYFNSEQFVYVAFLLSLGTMVGDSLGSFIKRRLGIESGRPFVLDTIFFLAIALVFAYNYAPKEYYDPQGILLLFMITLILHPSTNLIANRLGLKKVPW
ncbi:MAG TPA: CDP-2,3-bis-(O-geranylgeranyl)-sn-glycerol synthase [Candidatus Bilamarchaeaceae archaeon]|nr:CDP-2,3-bis-(O-geranylgeranyl)-sn-glycerol synthase [Candidatus Bilamarchaeaceae archaeon]